MKRTFLAIGLAVLASMLFAPHHDHWSLLDGVRWKYQREAYETTRKGDVFDDIDALLTQMIYVAGHGMFEFPRKMTPDQIRDVLQKKFPSDKEIVFKAASERPFDPDAYLANKLPPVTVYHPPEDSYYRPDWVDAWKWYPAFWPASSLLLTPFIAQTVFLATLAAVLVNLRQKKSG